MSIAMTSEKCRLQQCPYFDKVSGKAVCKYRKLTTGNASKEYIKHMDICAKVENEPVINPKEIV